MQRELAVNSRLAVPMDEFEFSYARSSGPGGQNVNKVNSKATLRWSPRRNTSLPEDVRQRFFARYRNKLSIDGEVILTSQRYRDQPRNVDDCLEKLRVMIASVAAPPVKRKRTRPSRGSVERRLEQKRVTGAKKQLRRRPAE
ncbi:MAG TPA: alternative ribosome rescue aminoacyl-tRNA hydrolase ArfB [Pirellulales bacterium]|jgi:ribosome-associated protein|nr:alternative ribosome rescue aminoacyl-tRNA hydrolase ArfB [Pirellulales bacterium]